MDVLEVLRGLVADIRQDAIPTAFIFFLVVVEIALTRVNPDLKRRGVHLFHNWIMTRLVVLIAPLAIPIFIVAEMASGPFRRVIPCGLLDLVPLPSGVRLVAGVLLAELATYTVHWLQHKIPFLWRIHRIHHSDTAIDATTHWRNHPLSIGFNFLGGTFVAVMLGATPEALVVYRTLMMFFAPFQHAQLFMPERLERVLSYFVVTPRTHLIHHSTRAHETNSNYTFCFTLWDRLFGTFRFTADPGITYGLDEYSDKKWQSFWHMLAMPFVRVPAPLPAAAPASPDAASERPSGVVSHADKAA